MEACTDMICMASGPLWTEGAQLSAWKPLGVKEQGVREAPTGSVWARRTPSFWMFDKL